VWRHAHRAEKWVQRNHNIPSHFGRLFFLIDRNDPNDPNDTNVPIVALGNEPVTIDYDMEKRPAGWKVWDVRVGGISLVANYRTEFDNLIRESGVEGLIKALSAKNNAQATLPVAGGLKK